MITESGLENEGNVDALGTLVANLEYMAESGRSVALTGRMFDDVRKIIGSDVKDAEPEPDVAAMRDRNIAAQTALIQMQNALGLGRRR